MCPQSTTPAPEPPASEEWRPITLYKEWEGVYSCSSLGRVRRETPSRGAQAGHILKPNTGPGGFLRVSLCYGGQRRYFPVHRLIALTFGPTTEPLAFRLIQVNHINGDKADNRPVNLDCVRRTRQRPLTRRERTLDHMLNVGAYQRMLGRRDRPIGSLPWEIDTGRAEVVDSG